MSKWVDRFESHELHKSLSNIDEIMEEVQETASSIDAEGVIDCERIAGSLNHVKRKLRNLDPILVPIPVLNDLNKHAQQIYNELNNFRSDENKAHLNNANIQVDSLLVQVSNLPSIDSLDDVEGVKKAITSFRRSAGQFIKHIEEENSNVQVQLTEISKSFDQLKTEIDGQKARLDTAISEFQKQFSEAEDRRRENFSNSEAEWQQKFSQAEENRNKEFKELYDTLQHEYEEKQEANSTQFETLIQTGQEKLKQIIIASHVKVEEALDLMEKHKERAERLITVITNTGMVGGYQKIANQDSESSEALADSCGYVIVWSGGIRNICIFVYAHGRYQLGSSCC